MHLFSLMCTGVLYNVVEAFLLWKGRKSMKILVIGNGVASFTLIRELLKHDGNFKMDVFSEEDHPFYWRPRLIELLANEADLETITPHDVKWYEDKGIALHLGEKVVQVNTEEKKLFTLGKREFEYDVLVIASGAKPFLPPVRGNDLKSVYTVRTYKDVSALKKNYGQEKKFVIIGGGVLGLEIAAALKRAGEDNVTVVEHSPYLLSRQLDSTGGQVLKNELKRHYDIDFLLSKSVTEIKGDGKVEGVTFSDGTECEADVVIFSTGVRTNVNFLENTEIKIERGIVVNDSLETNIKGVYAIGDVAQHRGIVYGTMPPAVEEAKILAGILNAEDVSYQGSIRSNMLKVAGLEVMSIGTFEPISGEELFSSQGDMLRGKYKKVIVKDGKFAGAIAVGVKKSDMLSMKNMVENGDKPTLPIYEYTKLEEGEK